MADHAPVKKIEPSQRDVVIDYTNWRGERKTYTVRVLHLDFKMSDFHGRERQWILTARDLDRDVQREFAMANVHSWKPALGVA